MKRKLSNNAYLALEVCRAEPRNRRTITAGGIERVNKPGNLKFGCVINEGSYSQDNASQFQNIFSYLRYCFDAFEQDLRDCDLKSCH
jgi:hypothetical protein